MENEEEIIQLENSIEKEIRKLVLNEKWVVRKMLIRRNKLAYEIYEPTFSMRSAFDFALSNVVKHENDSWE